MDIQTLISRAPVTVLLIASFVGLFVMQIVTGTDISEPSGQSLVKWGANYLPLTLSDEPWRLITSAFLHIGFMHLLFNTFAMYFFGQVAEILFGSVKLLLLFLLSAIGGNLLNLYDAAYWQLLSGGSVLSAGASGGIMGIGMALLTLEILRHTVLKPKPNPNSNTSVKYVSDTSLLKNLAVVMGINLIYGFAVPGIDNAGHIGGAITGAILATSFVFGSRNLNRLNASTRSGSFYQALPWLTCVIIAITFGLLWSSLHNKLIM